MDRRELLKLGLGSLAVGSFSHWPWAFATPKTDDHFFLTIFANGGWDTSYLFDARPLKMTEQGWIQNYLGQEPELWGQGDLHQWMCSPLVAPLKEHRDDFSLIKGVTMATTFDGHPQNVNYTFTGNPFGGEAFFPVMNQSRSAAMPLDGVPSSNLYLAANNFSKTVNFSASGLQSFIQKLRSFPIDTNDLGLHYIGERARSTGEGKGVFAKGARQLNQGLEESAGLASKIQRLELDTTEEDSTLSYLKMLHQLFTQKICFSGTLELFENFDSHSADIAKSQPTNSQKVVETLSKVFSFLKQTPFDSRRSLFDVTTVMVTSEFSRTMRIHGSPIELTGTNHNPQNNMVMLAGKGIRGGQLVGESDFQSAEESLSKAHLTIDPKKEKIMAQPFDFKTQKAIPTLPEKFEVTNYINMANVVNTMYSLFDVPESHWWEATRNAGKAPTLSRILK